MCVSHGSVCFLIIMQQHFLSMQKMQIVDRDCSESYYACRNLRARAASRLKISPIMTPPHCEFLIPSEPDEHKTHTPHMELTEECFHENQVSLSILTFDLIVHDFWSCWNRCRKTCLFLLPTHAQDSIAPLWNGSYRVGTYCKLKLGT